MQRSRPEAGSQPEAQAPSSARRTRAQRRKALPACDGEDGKRGGALAGEGHDGWERVQQAQRRYRLASRGYGREPGEEKDRGGPREALADAWKDAGPNGHSARHPRLLAPSQRTKDEEDAVLLQLAARRPEGGGGVGQEAAGLCSHPPTAQPSAAEQSAEVWRAPRGVLRRGRPFQLEKACRKAVPYRRYVRYFDTCSHR